MGDTEGISDSTFAPDSISEQGGESRYQAPPSTWTPAAWCTLSAQLSCKALASGAGPLHGGCALRRGWSDCGAGQRAAPARCEDWEPVPLSFRSRWLRVHLRVSLRLQHGASAAHSRALLRRAVPLLLAGFRGDPRGAPAAWRARAGHWPEVS
jgi:hypothetical protein